jgi:hypothetical protein
MAIDAPFGPAGEDDWVAAVHLIVPWSPATILWADEDSRAEVHVGSAAIRLGTKTGITFLALDDHAPRRFGSRKGRSFSACAIVDDDDTYESRYAQTSRSRLLQPGEYRVDVSEDGSQTVTTVFHGRGRVTGGGFHLYRGRESIRHIYRQRSSRL